MPHRLSCGLYALVVATSLCAGCSGRADLASVRGKVTLDGQPLTGAFVVYAPMARGTTSSRSTSPTSTLRIQTLRKNSGATKAYSKSVSALIFQR